MALYAFDGTGNEDKGVDEHGNDLDSNVLEFFRGYSDPLRNDDPKNELGSLYLKGIGTRAQTLLGDKFAEAFGVGGHKRIRQAMDRLENNADAGDMVVDVVGFSRGAALAISFANTIADKFPHVRIRFIGVWDIVGEFGLPGKEINAGHNLNMPPNVEHCYHAMALDETRVLFPLTRLGRKAGDDSERLREVWFRGVHSDVGGGNGNPGLNWISLNWMYQNGIRHGLPITAKAIEANLRDSRDKDGNLRLQQITDHKVDTGLVKREIRPTDILHTSVQLVAGLPGRPHNNPPQGMSLARIDDAGIITTPRQG